MELRIIQMVDDGGSWMKSMLKDVWFSRIVLIIRELFWTFWEKIFKMSWIIMRYHSWQSKLILSYFHGSQYTFCSAIHSWTYVSKTDIDWSSPGDCLDSWNTWMCANMVCLFLFQGMVSLFFCWLCSTNQIDNDFLFYVGCYIWHIWILEFYKKTWNVCISSNFYIVEHQGSY